MDTSVPAAPAASPKQQQQSQSFAATQLQQSAKEGTPPELEGLLRGMQEAQSYSNPHKHMSWVRRTYQEET